jgi:heat shock protein HslJ
VDGTSTPVPDGVVVDARFADGRIAGSGGCNLYGGPATVDGSSIEIGTLTSTQIACEGAQSEVEQAYLANLAAAASFTATADALTLYDADGAETLVFAAGPDNLVEGSWNVTGYNNGNQAVTSPIVGTTLTATFTVDAVSGNAGCNDYNGSYTIEGATVEIGPLVTTRMACEQDVMDQEAQYLAALQASTSVESVGGVVTLRDATGSTQVTLAAQ